MTDKLREELIEWITAYKDATECNALAEDPDESADYLISKIREYYVELDDDQSLPGTHDRNDWYNIGYDDAQREMWNADFRKVVTPTD